MKDMELKKLLCNKCLVQLQKQKKRTKLTQCVYVKPQVIQNHVQTSAMHRLRATNEHLKLWKSQRDE